MLFRVCALVALSALAACYEVSQIEGGRAFRVNKVTGDVYEISDGRLIRSRTPEQIEQELAARSPDELLLAARRNWTPLSLPVDGGTEVRLSTKFDESMQYVIEFNKDWGARPGRVLASVTLEMEDADGFVVSSTRIPLSEMTAILGNDQQSRAMQHRGRIYVTEDQYRQMTAYTVTWAGLE